MVPVLMQTPPTMLRRSITADLRPSLAAAMAAFWPPGPEPSTRRSYWYSMTALHGRACGWVRGPLSMPQETGIPHLHRPPGPEVDPPEISPTSGGHISDATSTRGTARAQDYAFVGLGTVTVAVTVWVTVRVIAGSVLVTA